MSLKSYKSKRDFKNTKEPKGSSEFKISSKKPIFVVQKHKASNLHYDFRIEVDGVLKSWAVPKGVPRKISDKRLAVATEDHPIEYAKFEGNIPEGEYGAGTVKIWDKGTYDNLSQKKDGTYMPVKSALRCGQIEINLYGKKLKGPYVLVRTKMRGDKKNWLLIKMKKK